MTRRTAIHPNATLGQLVCLAALLLASGAAAAGAGDSVSAIHVRRAGDAPEARETAKTVVNALRAQCDSAIMKQSCQITLSNANATPKAKAACAQMLAGFQLSGNLDSVGESQVDEYYAPALNRSARIVKTTTLRQTGVCSTEVEQQERHEIVDYRPGGFTRYERRVDKQGQAYWQQYSHSYVPGLANLLKTTVDAAQLGGTLTVSAPLGNKSLVPGRPCEQRRVSAGSVDFVSCIYATGRGFPSHVRFESEVIAGGKTSRFEKLASYAEDVAVSRDLFFPPRGEKVVAQPNMPSDPNGPTPRR